MAEDTKKELVCHCPYCESECKPIYPFCGNCGAPIKVCPKCGAALRKEEPVCKSCGARLSEKFDSE